MRHGVLFAAGAMLAGSGLALAQPAAWAPTQSVEMIVPAAAGGSNDLTGRLVQRIIQDAKLVRST